MESTLSLKFSDLTGEVGDFLGYGRGADNGETAWNTRTAAKINSHVMSGLRMVYFPDAMVSGGVSYDWSFLHVIRTIPLPTGESSVTLPDDFGGFEGPVILSSPQGRSSRPMLLDNEGSIDLQYAQLATTTGTPRLVALRTIRGTTKERGSRWQLYVWPIADEDYSFTIRYSILPAALNNPHPYPYGGATHAETFKAGCKAAAELDSDDKRGPQWQNFVERLAASISLDRRNKPQHYGYNADRSDGREWVRNSAWRDVSETVTYNGVAYE